MWGAILGGQYPPAKARRHRSGTAQHHGQRGYPTDPASRLHHLFILGLSQTDGRKLASRDRSLVGRRKPGIPIDRHDLASRLAGARGFDDARYGLLGIVLLLPRLEPLHPAVGPVDGRGHPWRYRAMHGHDHIRLGDALRQSFVSQPGDGARLVRPVG